MACRRPGGLVLAFGLVLAAASPAPAGPENPARRIVSLVPSITELLFVLGAGEQLLGVTSFCTWPEAARAVTVVGGGIAQTVSIESIVSLRPDLVYVSGAGQESIMETLRRLGVRVELVDPQNLEDTLGSFLAIGDQTGHRAAAEALVAEVRRRLAELAQRLDGRPRPRVFYQVWDEPRLSAGPETILAAVIRAAGGENLFDDVRERWPQVSEEAIVIRRPEVILAPDYHGPRLSVDSLAATPAWRDLPAVRHGRVHQLDGDIISRSGPRIAEAIRRVARLLHPDLAAELEESWVPPVPIPTAPPAEAGP